MSKTTNVLLVLSVSIGLGCATTKLGDSLGTRPDRAVDWLAKIEGRISDLSTKDEVNILLFGDSGKRKGLEKTSVWMQKSCDGECDLALMMGDNFYLFGPRSVKDRRFETHFLKPLSALGSDFDVWVVLGNHAYKGRGKPKAQIDFTDVPKPANGPDWLMPAQYFEIPKLPPWLNIVGFDSEFVVDDRHFRGSRMEFEAARDEHISRVTSALQGKDGWRVLFGHHPLLTTGHHEADDDLQNLRDIFEQRRPFQVYFAGHDHDQQVIEASDFVQIVQGAASKTRPKWTSEDRERAYRRLKNFTSWFGATTGAEYCSDLGYGIASFREKTLELAFFTENSVEVGRWTWSRDENGSLVKEGEGSHALKDLCP